MIASRQLRLIIDFQSPIGNRQSTMIHVPRLLSYAPTCPIDPAGTVAGRKGVCGDAGETAKGFIRDNPA
jgi:hypothetical protein